MDKDDLKPLLDVFLTLQATKELPRQGFINFGFKRNDSDSVAAHSFTVAVLAFFLAKNLQKQQVDVDADRTLKIALIHDMGEAISGDIGYHVKRFAGELLSRVEEQTFGMLVNKLEFADELTKYFKEYNASESLEAKIVKMADALDAYTQMLLTPGANLRTAQLFVSEKREGLLGESGAEHKLVEMFDNACQMLRDGEIDYLS
jgi:5'-deoxynucleotidase YfbR-like HD superfamily hydrolase